jgi:hypothetical protein
VAELINDLLKCVCFVISDSIYIVKEYDAINKRFRLGFKSEKDAKAILKRIDWDDKIDGWKLINSRKYKAVFTKSAYAFNNSNNQTIINFFSGF